MRSYSCMHMVVMCTGAYTQMDTHAHAHIYVHITCSVVWSTTTQFTRLNPLDDYIHTQNKAPINK